MAVYKVTEKDWSVLDMKLVLPIKFLENDDILYIQNASITTFLHLHTRAGRAQITL